MFWPERSGYVYQKSGYRKTGKRKIDQGIRFAGEKAFFEKEVNHV
jgi:hypothetical protein